MSRNHSLISIIVPVFNSAKWIEETLRSVALQTYPRALTEVIIVDDGSTDDSLKIAASILKMSGIDSKIFRTSNAGPSAARNIGWRNAKGEWIQFLDSDDVLAIDKIAIQLQAAERAGREVAIIYSNWADLEFCDDRWRVSSKEPQPCRPPTSPADLLRPEAFIACGSQIFRKLWLEQVDGFNQAYRLIEDVELLLRIAMAGGRFEHVNPGRPLFYYRRRRQSLSRSDRAEFVAGCLRNAHALENHLRQANGCLTAEQTEVLLQVYQQAARFLYEYDREQFYKIYLHMLALQPDFLPRSPAALRLLSALLGYPRAESLALTYRRVKRLLLASVSR